MTPVELHVHVLKIWLLTIGRAIYLVGYIHVLHNAIVIICQVQVYNYFVYISLLHISVSSIIIYYFLQNFIFHLFELEFQNE